ncbi:MULTISPECIES: BRO-N domain-containing protein [Aeromonas]|uniref:BRO-N domain-containing protein n=1 Tax=Aeromonas TaxID=642 RepID=UPI001C22B400|nr:MULTISPECIES: Bro-N domain-containing protein [Aeromonas]QXB98597.1 Bro-N domain-containing protein [Aeromonas sp. FDAARGOS 1418]WEA32239.1 Bro-N domain-containing protein [Aeromonas hydrophila]
MTIQQQYPQTKVLAGPQNDGGSLIMKSFENYQIRIITDEQGEPWFVAKDVCEALGYTNSRKALADHVDEEDVTKRDTLTKGGVQAVSCINESGLYSLILSSKLENAKRMKRWVTSEVLPSIRKTGSYGAPAANLPDFSNPAAAARAWAEEYERGQVLAIENKQQQEQIHSLESLFRQGMTIPQFCKMLNGVNVHQVCAYFEDRGWLFNESRSGKSNRWRVKSQKRDRYLTEEQLEIRGHGHEPFVRFTPVLLQKGAVRIYQLYLKGELPMKKDWDGLFTQDKVIKGAA